MPKGRVDHLDEVEGGGGVRRQMRGGKLEKQMKGSKTKNTPVVNTFKLLTGFELNKSLNIFSP